MFEQFKNLQKINFDDLYNTFLGLDKRQQTLAVLGFVLVFLIFLWLPAQFLSVKISNLQENYVSYQSDAQKLKQALNEYGSMQAALTQTSTVGAEDSLSGLIYNMSEEFGIPKKKVSLKSMSKLPQGDLFEQDGKDVEIKAVPFDQLMRLIHGLESNTKIPIVMKKLDMKVDKKNRQVINQATFTVMTIKAKKI